MANRKVARAEKLVHLVVTRVNDAKYTELLELLKGDPNNDMSRLLRDILYDRPITVFVKDKSLDNVMEELTRLRTELKSIGVNINQITRRFNTYPDDRRKAFYAKIAFEKYSSIEIKVEELLTIIAKLGEKWLQR